MRTLLACIVIVTAVAACGKSDTAPTVEEDSRLSELADEACACTTLGCIDKKQRTLHNMLSATHESQLATDVQDAIKARVAACTDKLANDMVAKVKQLADDLCACPDRACYDGLRSRVDTVFAKENTADVGPRMLAAIKAEADRFNACDEKFTAAAPAPAE